MPTVIGGPGRPLERGLGYIAGGMRDAVRREQFLADEARRREQQLSDEERRRKQALEDLQAQRGIEDFREGRRPPESYRNNPQLAPYYAESTPFAMSEPASYGPQVGAPPARFPVPMNAPLGAYPPGAVNVAPGQAMPAAAPLPFNVNRSVAEIERDLSADVPATSVGDDMIAAAARRQAMERYVRGVGVAGRRRDVDSVDETDAAAAPIESALDVPPGALGGFIGVRAPVGMTPYQQATIEERQRDRWARNKRADDAAEARRTERADHERTRQIQKQEREWNQQLQEAKDRYQRRIDKANADIKDFRASKQQKDEARRFLNLSRYTQPHIIAEIDGEKVKLYSTADVSSAAERKIPERFAANPAGRSSSTSVRTQGEDANKRAADLLNSIASDAEAQRLGQMGRSGDAAAADRLVQRLMREYNLSEEEAQQTADEMF